MSGASPFFPFADVKTTLLPIGIDEQLREMECKNIKNVTGMPL